jgi:hypothetical protein
MLSSHPIALLVAHEPLLEQQMPVHALGPQMLAATQTDIPPVHWDCGRVRQVPLFMQQLPMQGILEQVDP